MAVYIPMTVLAVWFAWLSGCVSEGKKQKTFGLRRISAALLYFFAFLSIFLVSAFREGVGTDYWNYADMFWNPAGQTGNTIFDSAVVLLTVFFSDYHILYILSSLIICGGICYVNRQESDSPALSILLFVIMEDYFVSMNIFRQYISIIFILIAILEMRRRKTVNGLLFYLYAVMLHTSALVALPVFILPRLRFSKKWLVVGTAGGVAAVLIGCPILKKLLMFTSYGHYFSSHYATETYSVSLPMLMIYVTILLTVLVLCDGEQIKKDEKLRLFCVSDVGCILVMVLSYGLTANSYRLSYYFNVILGVYFPRMLNAIPNEKLRRLVKYAMIILFTIWTVMLIYHRNQNALPYHTWLTDLF